jgi:hypothetical protein
MNGRANAQGTADKSPAQGFLFFTGATHRARPCPSPLSDGRWTHCGSWRADAWETNPARRGDPVGGDDTAHGYGIQAMCDRPRAFASCCFRDLRCIDHGGLTIAARRSTRATARGRSGRWCRADLMQPTCPVAGLRIWPIGSGEQGIVARVMTRVCRGWSWCCGPLAHRHHGAGFPICIGQGPFGFSVVAALFGFGRQHLWEQEGEQGEEAPAVSGDGCVIDNNEL